MKITAHTERGVFVSVDIDELSMDEVLSMLTDAVVGKVGVAQIVSFKTTAGHVLIGADLLKTAVFVVED